MSTTTPTSSATPTITPGEWEIDAAHSEVGFTVRHLGLSKVRGRFNDVSGTATVGATPADSSVTAVIALASVDTNNSQRDEHLRSADFFNTDSNHNMTFASTAVTEHALVGDLTIGGVTKSVELDLEVYGQTTDPYGNTKAGFSATGEISRSDFGISFNAPVGLDGALVSDKVRIELDIQLAKSAE